MLTPSCKPSWNSSLVTKKINNNWTKNKISNILWKSEFAEILELKVANLDSLIIFNHKTNDIISELIIKENYLKNADEKFLEALKTSSLSKFSWEEREKELLMNLIEKKSLIYRKILLECIKKGNFNFLKEDLQDIVNLIESGIFEWQNKLFREHAHAVEREEDIDLWDNIYYWIPCNYSAWNYQDSIQKSSIKIESIKKINNQHLKAYLEKMINLSSSWNNNYKDWIEAEKNEVYAWQSDDNIVFLSPMENYMHKNFIDPELLVLSREKTGRKPENFADLSYRQFGNKYGMEKVWVFFVEKILGWWETTFGQFLGKSFPNDMDLRENYGNFVAVLKWEYPRLFDEYYKIISKIFTLDEKELLEKKSQIIAWAMEETVYHEYGHSLFWVQSTEIEEVKATIFYWTHLFDEYINKKQLLNANEIKRIIYSFTLDFTRYISRLNNPRYRKYVYTAQIELFYLMNCGIVFFDDKENTLKLNLSNEDELINNFSQYLKEMMWVADIIKSIYETKDKKREENMTKYYNDKNFEIIKKLYKNI